MIGVFLCLKYLQPFVVMTVMSWIKTRVASFSYAFKGMFQLFATETHAQIHLLAMVVVILAGFAVGIKPVEWGLIVLAIALVIAAEGFNTALEALADALHPGHHPLVGTAKDIAAGAVLVCAIAAVVIAAIVFLPYWL